MQRRQGNRPEPCRALVTGGSGTIGGAICHALASAGMDVIVHAGNNLKQAEHIADSIQGQGGRAHPVAFDLTDDQATEQAMEQLLDRGPVPVVIHNAGRHLDSPLAGMAPDQWRQIIDINLNAFYRVVQPALLPMARCGWGRVIAMSSLSARLGNRGQANYAAAKAGLHGAVFSLCREMAGRGITANVVAPGLIDSDMLGELYDAGTIRQMVPAGRTGTPEEVASLIAYLCSDEAGYINGQVIGVDGGMAPG